MNPRLRTIVADAKAANMPNDNIARAIRRGTGEEPGVNYEEVTYEGYGPGGVAILVHTLTDNRVRTVAEIRNMLTKHGGNMGAAGSVGYIFTKRGLIAIERKDIDEDQVMETALEAGAEDVREAGDLLEVLTAPETFDDVREALAKVNIATASAEITMIPSSTVNVSGHSAQTLLKLLELLEDHDDVQSVSSNMDIAAEELEQLSA